MKITPAEREDLEGALAAIQRGGAKLEQDRATARQLVDITRQQFPDIDDVAIGRLLLWAGGIVRQLDETGHSATEIQNVMVFSGIDFLAEELARGDD